MRGIKKVFKELKHFPTAVVGLVLISLLFIMAITTMVVIPYSEAKILWRGDEATTYKNPINARPAWTNIFREEKWPESFAVKFSESDDVIYTVIDKEENENTEKITTKMSYSFDYNYGEFPQEILIYFDSDFVKSKPFVEIRLLTPEGRDIKIISKGLRPEETYRFNQDMKLESKLGEKTSLIGLFATLNPKTPEEPEVAKGTYTLTLTSQTFEAGSSVDAEVVLHGLVYGFAGTDHRRRDLMTALLWGAPIALLFGMVASIGVSVLSMVISAMGVWFGGWVDALIQRITEVNMLLPFLAILVMIGTFYSKSIWTMLGVTILLSIFTAAIKTYRATFMQMRNAAYIEAALTYGASNSRIVFRYLIPRIIPLLIPGLVLSIPGFVFLEASLNVLGLGDPVLPTWGKVISDAYYQAALYNGNFYWIIQPAILLMITGLAFAMVGFSLDRLFNPRLREQ
ncbi:MAG: ABC transporter permease [Clostridiales bacterium]|nr:ABC transporter permease [Clostridiales bacterium]